MSFIGRYLSIRACVRDLSQRLARKYGLKDSYSVAEIEAVLDDWNMQLRFPAYAYAVFCSRSGFDCVDPDIRVGVDYDESRRDVLRQYPRLSSLNGREVAIFARSWWYGVGTRSRVDMPDGFQPDRPPSPTGSIYAEPSLGIPGMLVSLVGAAALLALLAFFVGRHLLG